MNQIQDIILLKVRKLVIKKEHRILKKDIFVVCADGETLTGYVVHYVKGPASATNIKNWFIFQPGNYPTKYIIQRKEIVDTANIKIIEL